MGRYGLVNWLMSGISVGRYRLVNWLMSGISVGGYGLVNWLMSGISVGRYGLVNWLMSGISVGRYRLVNWLMSGVSDGHLYVGGRPGPPEITEKTEASYDLLRIIGNCWWVLSNQPSCLGFLSLKSFVITKCEVNCLCVLVRFIF